MPHKTNIDLSVESGLEFPRLPHKRLDHAIENHDVKVLEPRIEYLNKDAFLAALKQYRCFKGKCTQKDERCKWKVIAPYWKKSKMSTIKKYVIPHTCVMTGASQDHLRLDSNIIVDIIILMVRARP